MSGPEAPARQARRRGKSVVGRLIAYVFLGGVLVFVLAVIIRIVVPSEERSYTGTAEVVKSHQQKSLCSIDVRLSDGTEYSYVIRSTEDGYCQSFTPGAMINIEEGDVANPEGKKP